jgi:hypothetical protein
VPGLFKSPEPDFRFAQLPVLALGDKGSATMPAPANVAEFLDLVRKSNLLPDTRLDELIDRHRASGTLPQSTDHFAALLVREGLLTFFQAKQLKLGRYKRFTIGSK